MTNCQVVEWEHHMMTHQVAGCQEQDGKHVQPRQERKIRLKLMHVQRTPRWAPWVEKALGSSREVWAVVRLAPDAPYQGG